MPSHIRNIKSEDTEYTSDDSAEDNCLKKTALEKSLNASINVSMITDKREHPTLPGTQTRDILRSLCLLSYENNL